MIRLIVADWIVSVEAQPAALDALAAERYAAFAPSAMGEPELRVRVTWEPGAATGGSILTAGLLKNGEEYLLDAPEFYGMIAPSRGQAELRMRSDNPTREVEYFLRVALALFAWSRGGLLVHSAALLVDAAAFLFIGQSGSGKSTVVSLSQGRNRSVALGDDLVLLRYTDEGWRVFGTPFWNLQTSARDGQTASGRAQAIYKLVQDREVFAEPMSVATAAAELLANCPIVNSQPALLADLMLRCRDIVEAVGAQRLHFRKDAAFWDIIAC